MKVPERWTQIRLESLWGPVLIIGAPDVGKSTLAQYLYRHLIQIRSTVAYIDGDPGQSYLGPPTTITLVVGGGKDTTFPPPGPRRHCFIGDVSPQGHMLPLVAGAHRLVHEALSLQAEVIIYDTCGLVNPRQGGHTLKMALIELLEPTTVFAIQREHELEGLLLPLRLSQKTRVVDLKASTLAVPRDYVTRRANRANRFAAYFAEARPLEVNWGRLAVFPEPRFPSGRLVALEDSRGFTLALGIVVKEDLASQRVVLYTPLASLSEVKLLRLGDLILEPHTYQDQPLEVWADYH